MARKIAYTVLAAHRIPNMPLLTELGWSDEGTCYRHGAPNGAVPPGQHPIPPKTAKNHHLFAGWVFGCATGGSPAAQAQPRR
jgi:hypothetical protein